MSTLDIVISFGIALALVLGLIVVLGGVVWFWRRRRDEEEDTTDPDGDGDPDPDGDGNPDLIDATPDPTQPANGPIAALDLEVNRGVRAMLEQADDELTKKLRRETINPLRQSLLSTRIALGFVTVALVTATTALWVTHPMESDLALHGSTTDEDGNLVTLDQRLHVIEAWQTENTVTSPLVRASYSRSFSSLEDLLGQFYSDSIRAKEDVKELESLTSAMAHHLDCYTERLDNTPDEQGCYELTCTILESTFTRLHRWDAATSSWSPCD